ncbi:hypothetical protein EV714DRAFT_240521, partial [Schizophyllum commune]
MSAFRPLLSALTLTVLRKPLCNNMPPAIPTEIVTEIVVAAIKEACTQFHRLGVYTTTAQQIHARAFNQSRGTSSNTDKQLHIYIALDGDDINTPGSTILLDYIALHAERISNITNVHIEDSGAGIRDWATLLRHSPSLQRAHLSCVEAAGGRLNTISASFEADLALIPSQCLQLKELVLITQLWSPQQVLAAGTFPKLRCLVLDSIDHHFPEKIYVHLAAMDLPHISWNTSSAAVAFSNLPSLQDLVLLRPRMTEAGLMAALAILPGLVMLTIIGLPEHFCYSTYTTPPLSVDACKYSVGAALLSAMGQSGIALLRLGPCSFNGSKETFEELGFLALKSTLTINLTLPWCEEHRQKAQEAQLFCLRNGPFAMLDDLVECNDRYAEYRTQEEYQQRLEKAAGELRLAMEEPLRPQFKDKRSTPKDLYDAMKAAFNIQEAGTRFAALSDFFDVNLGDDAEATTALTDLLSRVDEAMTRVQSLRPSTGYDLDKMDLELKAMVTMCALAASPNPQHANMYTSLLLDKALTYDTVKAMIAREFASHRMTADGTPLAANRAGFTPECYNCKGPHLIRDCP